jgi:nucleoside-diphosphate-sugar epimerase
VLSEPTPAVIDTLGRLEGDLLLLGVAGKMGPTLARMARRASDQAGVRRRVIGVARFTDVRQEKLLQAHGVETLRCDLLDTGQLEALPDVPNVVYLAGRKFGSTGQEALTWAVNCYLPAMVCQRFRQSRMVALSTGNVYGLTSAAGTGSREGDTRAPIGDYAQSCIGRERIFEHFSRTLDLPLTLLRLNYATDLRYGVLVDIAQRVGAGKPVDLATGFFNTIWQADANAMILCALGHAAVPPLVVNVTGPERLSVRQVAVEFGRLLGKEPIFQGTEGAEALLSNGELGHRLFGLPRVTADQLIRGVATWLKRGGETLGKPTHFEVRDGVF